MPLWDRSCRSNLLSHPATVSWHVARLKNERLAIGALWLLVFKKPEQNQKEKNKCQQQSQTLLKRTGVSTSGHSLCVAHCVLGWWLRAELYVLMTDICSIFVWVTAVLCVSVTVMLSVMLEWQLCVDSHVKRYALGWWLCEALRIRMMVMWSVMH